MTRERRTSSAHRRHAAATCGRFVLAAGVLLAAVAASFVYLKLDFGALFSADSVRSSAKFAAEFFPPDVSASFIRKTAWAALQTLAVSAVGTLLAGVEGIECLAIPEHVEPNSSYFPILVGPDYPLSRDALYERLKSHDIFSRRYFFPLLSNLPMYADLPSAAPGNLPTANRAAAEILCLPIYPELGEDDQRRIVEVIADAAS